MHQTTAAVSWSRENTQEISRRLKLVGAVVGARIDRESEMRNLSTESDQAQTGSARLCRASSILVSMSFAIVCYARD